MDGTICYSRHREGRWSYTPIAGNLPKFFAMLAAWLRYFVVDHGSNLFDDNFDIAQHTREEMTRTVVVDTSVAYRDAAMHFALGEI
jgi:hypothetical protein